MKIMHILPELEEGGVERHVLMLSGQLKKEGHEVYVISAGGKLVPHLADGIVHMKFPVHSKNPLVGIYCAFQLAPVVRKNNINIIHAHSRVPAWIAMLAGNLSQTPYVVTAHGYFSTQTKWIYIPYRRANTVICVSKSVQSGMQKCFAANTVVIRNGMPDVKKTWQGSGEKTVHFLFIGRLTKLKGLQDVLKVLPSVRGDWKLDILGDGPLCGQLKEMTKSMQLEEQVIFHGFRDDPDFWMERSDCLLFPSYVEGMPLTLARAVQIGMPVIASGIEPVSEMAFLNNGLVKPGDLVAWKKAIETFLVTKQAPIAFDKGRIPTVAQMAQEVQSVYAAAISQKGESH